MTGWIIMIVTYVVVQGFAPSQPTVSFIEHFSSQMACKTQGKAIEQIETVKSRVKVRTTCFRRV